MIETNIVLDEQTVRTMMKNDAQMREIDAKIYRLRERVKAARHLQERKKEMARQKVPAAV